MFKLSTKIALAALLSISALSTVDATRRIKGQEYMETDYHHETRSGKGYNFFSRVARTITDTVHITTPEDNQDDDVDNFNHAPVRRDGEYHLSQHDIYGQPANTGLRGQYIDYSEESFADKAKRFVSNHKKEILIGTAILTAVVGTVSYFMSGGQEEEEQYPSYPSGAYDTTYNTGELNDFRARLAQQALDAAEYAVRMGLNTVASPETAVAVWEPQPSFIGSVVNTASHWLSGMTRQFYGS